MRHWTEHALELIARGEPVALITLTHVQGSAPRDAGARMLVWADGQFDTIGGGNLEFMIAREARQLLLSGEGVGGEGRANELLPKPYAQTPHAPDRPSSPTPSPQGRRGYDREYPLGPILGQCCGGRVTARIEVLDASNAEWLKSEERVEAKALTPLIMFGAGHVGEAIARAVSPLPLRLHWYDTRVEFTTEATLADDPLAVVAEAPPRALFLVITHNHDLDYELVRAMLARRDAAYCGLIGSKSKRVRFERQLRADGLAGELRRLTCPIGGSIGLKGKEPATIAAATVAELMLLVEALNADAPEHAHAD